MTCVSYWKNGQQILVKEVWNYIRLHLCNSKLRKSNTATTDLSVSDREKRLLKLLIVLNLTLDSGEIN